MAIAGMGNGAATLIESYSATVKLLSVMTDATPSSRLMSVLGLFIVVILVSFAFSSFVFACKNSIILAETPLFH